MASLGPGAPLGAKTEDGGQRMGDRGHLPWCAPGGTDQGQGLAGAIQAPHICSAWERMKHPTGASSSPALPSPARRLIPPPPPAAVSRVRAPRASPRCCRLRHLYEHTLDLLSAPPHPPGVKCERNSAPEQPLQESGAPGAALLPSLRDDPVPCQP